MVSAYTSTKGVVLTLLWASASAAPVKRNDPNNPIPMTVDVSAWQDMAEMNCFQMLCRYGGGRIWQRGERTDNDKAPSVRHRQEAGTNLHPFQPQNLSKYDTAQLTSGTTSAEEFPWASMERGGEGAHLMPAAQKDQTVQGRKVNSGYNAANVDYGDWFKVTFTGYRADSKYCKALFREPPDFSVCDNGAETQLYGQSVNPANWDWVKEPNTNPGVFKHPK